MAAIIQQLRNEQLKNECLTNEFNRYKNSIKKSMYESVFKLLHSNDYVFVGRTVSNYVLPKIHGLSIQDNINTIHVLGNNLNDIMHILKHQGSLIKINYKLKYKKQRSAFGDFQSLQITFNEQYIYIHMYKEIIPFFLHDCFCFSQEEGLYFYSYFTGLDQHNYNKKTFLENDIEYETRMIHEIYKDLQNNEISLIFQASRHCDRWLSFYREYKSLSDNGYNIDFKEYTFLQTIEEKNPDCSICHESMSNDIIQLKCNHIYHSKCMERWIGAKKECSFSCPLCRTKIDKILTTN